MSFGNYFKKIEEGVVSNNVPYGKIGVWMYDRFGMRLNFKKIGGKLIYQAAIKFDIHNKETNEKLFNFITATNFETLKKEIDSHFYDMAHLATLAAISYFNRQIKLNKSTLTVNRSYPEIPSEKNKEAIRSAWRMSNFGDARPSDN
jgi:hypothetical protein